MPGLEDPAQRVEDIKAAVSFLTTRAEADPGRIGALGICASGGYVLPATATDHRIRAVATVSAADMGRQFRVGADGGQDPAVILSMLDAAADARSAEARGEGTAMFPIFPETEEEARAGGRHLELVAPRPLLMIAGQEAATAWMSREAVGMAREPKELHWIEGATHVSLYDVEPDVAAAVAKLSGFFHARLGGLGEGAAAAL